jgi:signal transduction histidine kinase
MHAMYPMELPLHVSAVILSLAAVACAFFLVPLSGRTKTWPLLCAAFVLFAAERLIELMAHAGLLFDAQIHEVVSDVLLAAMSACLFGGICFIRALFIERNAERRKLEQQLDELRRFHQATVSRELRMKELHEENLALKAQLGGPRK